MSIQVGGTRGETAPIVVFCPRFFEWQRGGGQKQPYFVQFADSSPTEEMMEVTAEPEEGDTEMDIPGGE